jgi:hypothetical protein
MGNFRWFRRTLEVHLQSDDSILEIGAGAGDLGNYLASTQGFEADLKLDGLDLCSRPTCWNDQWGWHKTDLNQFEGYASYSVVLTSMILHQLTDHQLLALGRKLGRTCRLIVASEPARRKLHLFHLQLCKLLGTSPDTDHDAKVSIEAGFLGQELPILLGLNPGQWNWRCTNGLFGQYRMVAFRTGRIQ